MNDVIAKRWWNVMAQSSAGAVVVLSRNVVKGGRLLTRQTLKKRMCPIEKSKISCAAERDCRVT